MFESLSNYLQQRAYFEAGAILSRLGSLLLPANKPLDMSFYNARIETAALDECMHVFIQCDSLQQFRELPGDLKDTTDHPLVRLLSKRFLLGETWDIRYKHGIVMHFMWCEEIKCTRTTRSAISEQ